MEGLGRSVGDAISGAFGGLLDAAGAAFGGVVNAFATVPGGWLWLVGAAVVVIIGWRLVR